MKRILFQTVGTGGPDNPVWQALAFAVRDRRPELVVWCCSQLSKDQTLGRVRRELKDESLPEQDVRVCQNPHDVERLWSEYVATIDEWRQRRPEAHIEVDYTSGTKAMSAAMVLAAVSRQVDRLHYAVGPVDASGRAIRTERLVSVSPDAPLLDQRLNELGRLFDLGQFDAVREGIAAVRHRAQEPKLFQRATSLDILAEAYSLWDRFDWKHAQDILHRTDRNDTISAAGWNLQALKQQANHVRVCGQQWNSPQRLADLLANADRRLTRGRYDDAVARLYRLTEYVGQVRFAARFDIERPNATSKVPVDLLTKQVPDVASAVVTRAQRKGKSLVVNLGLYETIQALAEAGDPVGNKMKELHAAPDPSRPEKKGPLGQQLDIRNESLLAHGAQPVTKDDAHNLRNMGKSILESHLSAEGIDLNDLLLPAQFLSCPW